MVFLSLHLKIKAHISQQLYLWFLPYRSPSNTSYSLSRKALKKHLFSFLHKNPDSQRTPKTGTVFAWPPYSSSVFSVTPGLIQLNYLLLWSLVQNSAGLKVQNYAIEIDSSRDSNYVFCVTAGLISVKVSIEIFIFEGVVSIWKLKFCSLRRNHDSPRMPKRFYNWWIYIQNHVSP